MIHTMLITHRTNKKVYDEIYETIKRVSGAGAFLNDKNSREHKSYKTHAFKVVGLSEIVFRPYYLLKGIRHNIYQIEIRLNPKRLIEKENRIKILNESDLPKFLKEFDSIIHLIHSNLPGLYGWTMNRIDYAVNVKTPYVKEYIQLFQRADKPRHFIELKLVNGRIGQKSGSLSLHTKYVTINFYNKEEQVKVNNPLDTKTIMQAQNILRIEIQLKNGKTSEMKKKKEFLNKEVSNYLKLDHSYEVIMNYYKKTIGEGDYYTLAEARRLIGNNQKLTSYTKKKLTDCLQLINEKRSIWKAREEYKDTRSFNTHLKAIRAMGINPVTIPVNWEIPFLKNPLKEIERKFNV